MTNRAETTELSQEEMLQVQGCGNTRCTGDACNGGSAGILFGTGGDGGSRTFDPRNTTLYVATDDGVY